MQPQRVSASRLNRCSLIRVLAACVALLLPSSVAWAQAAAGSREYKDGPLTPADFKMPPPAAAKARTLSPAAAYVEVQSDYGTRSNNRDGTGRAELTRVRYFAVVFRDRSWNRDPKDQRALAHEQGRFDLAELQARTATARVTQMIADGKLKFTGGNEPAALDALKKAMDAEFQKIQKDFVDEQQRYDAETRQGTKADQQTRWRKKLDELLAATPAAPAPAPKK